MKVRLREIIPIAGIDYLDDINSDEWISTIYLDVSLYIDILYTIYPNISYRMVPPSYKLVYKPHWHPLIIVISTTKPKNLATFFRQLNAIDWGPHPVSYIFIHTSIHISTYIYTCIYVYVYTYTYVYIYTSIYTSIYASIYTYIYNYIYLYIYLYTHIITYIQCIHIYII